MYRVMIVDDEPVIRKGLIHFIQWQDIECEIICQAEDGISAKALISAHKPDIVITDIKMPGLDGIQLAQYVYEYHPSIKVILLTGYSDFYYAQSAIRYNVVDFILKPSSTEKVIAAVYKAKNVIVEMKNRENELLNLQWEVKENLQQIQEKFIQDFINGIFSSSETILNRMEQLNIQVNHFYVFVLEMEEPRGMDSPFNNRNMLMEIKQFLSSIFKDHPHYTLITNSQSLCGIISFDDANHPKCMQYLLKKCEEILYFVNSFIHISASIGISDVHTDPLHIPMAFHEACDYLTYKFYDNNHIFIYSDYTSTQSNFEEKTIHKYIDRILDYIKEGNCENACILLKELLEIQRHSKQPIQHIKTTSVLLCSLCLKLLGSYQPDTPVVFGETDNIYYEILECESMEKLFMLLKTIIHAVTSCVGNGNMNTNHIIRKAMEYIEENYCHPIKLDALADYVHVNSSYLSRLFRKETGETLTDIINRIRVNKAKDLLHSSTLKTYEVAMLVGIEDSAYFSQVFKKFTGLSPTEYRKQ